MEKVTPEKIRHALRTYLNTLYGDQLHTLVRATKTAETMLQLPSSLKDALGLRKYFLTRNLLEVLRQELVELIPWRCLNGNMVSPEHSKWIEDIMESDGEIRIEDVDDIPQIIQDYSRYLQTLVKKQGYKEKEFGVKFYTEEYKDIPYVFVKKTVIYLSEVIEEVEKVFSLFQGRVKDVHFVANEAFYVDCSLENEQWHGVDILIISRKVVCLQLDNKAVYYDNYCYKWDISGVHGKEIEPEMALQSKNGISGNCGEHGGHLLCIANEFVNMNYLVVLSNGGNGGRGQHGGHGKDGEDGKNGAEWSFKETLKIFPNSVGSDGLRNFVLENVLDLGGLDVFKYEPAGAIDSQSGRVTGNVTEFYAKGKTKEGVEYQVGFQKGVFQKTAFVLVNGGLGSDGGAGGPGGVGGQGGMCGRKGSVTLLYAEKPIDESITARQGMTLDAVLTDGKTGSRGMNGVTGKRGENGRNGRDVGYMAWSGKDLLKFPPGRYELKMRSNNDDECKEIWKNLETINHSLLGKYVVIIPRSLETCKFGTNEVRKYNSILSKITWVSDKNDKSKIFVNETLKRIEKYKVMQRQGRHISQVEIIDEDNFQVENDFNWWIKKILDI